MGLLIYKYEPLWQEVSLKSHTQVTVKAFSSSTVLQIYEILGESILLMETKVSMPLYKGGL